MPGQTLYLLDDAFSIHRLDPDADVPEAVRATRFHWIGRTDEELSIVCPSEVDVAGAARTEPGWCCLKVAGPIDFAVVGVLAGLARALAAVGVSVFALSTFDTDYLLVKSADIGRARAALRDAGYRIAPA